MYNMDKGNIFQTNEELLFIKNFQVFRARANLISFFRSLLLQFFGDVDSKLSVYIPDVKKFLSQDDYTSASPDFDVRKSIVQIKKWFAEERRGVPFVLIVPGILQEVKTELSGENFHFMDGSKAVFGSMSNTDVSLIVGAQSDTERIRLGDMVYSAFTQFYRKNYHYFDEAHSTHYSILIKNDSIRQSTDQNIDVSQHEKIYMVGVGIPILLEWQYSVNLGDTVFAHEHKANEEVDLDTRTPEEFYTGDFEDLPPRADIPDSEVNTDQIEELLPVLDSDLEDIQIIQTYLYTNVDQVDFLDDTIDEVDSVSDIIGPQVGDRYIIDGTLSEYDGSLFQDVVVSEGAVTFVTNKGFSYIYLEEAWIQDKYSLIG